MDSGDKATNKAMSAAFKYAAFQAFCIPTEGDNDADAHTPEVAPKQMSAVPRMSADVVSPILHSISAAPDSAALKQIAEDAKAICITSSDPKTWKEIILPAIVAKQKERE